MSHLHTGGFLYLQQQHCNKKNNLQISKPVGFLAKVSTDTAATPRVSATVVKKASAYPNAAAARSAVRRPSVTSKPEMSAADTSDLEDAAPPLIRALTDTTEVLPRA